jgi:OmpA-OmpF porin, OOP family
VRLLPIALLLLTIAAGSCSRGEEPAAPPSSNNQSSVPPAKTGDKEPDPLSGLLEALDPKSRPVEPWPLEPAPPDWRSQPAPDVPVVAGFTEIVAVQEPRGDYESVAHVEAVERDAVKLAFSLRSGSVAGVTSMRARRTVLTQDLAEARGYRMTFSEADPESFPGMTALGVSTAVFRELHDGRRPKIDLHAGVDAVATLLAAADALASDLTGELARDESDPVGVPVLVNGQRVWLPALHAKGEFQGVLRSVPAEFWFLADPANPLTLRAMVDRARLQVVRIDFPAAERTSTLERALAERQPVEMWGVYFEFGSARLQPESSAVLDAVAGLLGRHPDWRLRIGGHTDNVGADDDNLKLSEQRAQTVRAELVRRLPDASTRIEAAGFGESQPRESNDTLSGRARNRRVELTRQ